MGTTSLQLSREERLLLRLARVRPEPQPEPHELDGIDAKRFLFLAARLGNFALLAKRFLKLATDLDDELRARTESNLAYYRVREGFALADLKELTARLAASGAPLVLLKGAAYNRFIYPRGGLRNYQDIDVLLDAAAVAKAREILRAMGYAEQQSIEGSVDMVKHLGGRMPSLLIELHTQLVHHHEYPYYRAELALDEGRLMERSEERLVDDTAVRILHPADELFYSVVHFFFHHDFAGLKYHSDVNALLTDPARPLDLDEAVTMARAARAGYAVGLTLLVQRAIFGADAVPERLVRELAPRGLRCKALRACLPPPERAALGEGRVAGHPAKVLTAPGLLAPLGLGLRWLFPGRRFLMDFYEVGADGWRSRYHLRYAGAIAKKAYVRLIRGLPDRRSPAVR